MAGGHGALTARFCQVKTNFDDFHEVLVLAGPRDAFGVYGVRQGSFPKAMPGGEKSDYGPSTQPHFKKRTRIAACAILIESRQALISYQDCHMCYS